MAESALAPEQKLPKAPPELPDDEVLYELADLFRVFGDSTRIKILYALHDDELCVQDIANAVQLSQSAVSHQCGCSRTQSSSASAATARPFTMHWTMTMCAASSPWAWTTSKSDAPKTLQALPHPAAERGYRKKGWYLL